MEFHYVATNSAGRIEKGVIDARSKEIVADRLRERNLMVISIAAPPHGFGHAALSGVTKAGFGHVSLLDKVIFARHLSLMLRSGLALIEALEVIKEQTTSKKMGRVISGVLKDISNGATLADSLEKYPRVFSNIFVGMVRVGEASGTLERNLEYVAGVLEKDYELRKKVIAALIYPIIILVATFFVAAAMTIFVLPKLVKMFETFKISLPLATRIFLGLAKFMVANGLYVFIGAVVLVVVIRILVRARPTRPFFHLINIHLPFLKRVIRNINLARAMTVLAVLLKSGVTINEGLAITAKTIDNARYRQIFEGAVVAVKKGTSLSAALRDNPLIPVMTSRMIAVGEKTGKLEENLFYLSDFYSGEVEQATKNLSSVIGPVLMIVIGVVLGLLAIAIISPIYQFTGSLGR
jgi:type IV pilus assembly protein PilC